MFPSSGHNTEQKLCANNLEHIMDAFLPILSVSKKTAPYFYVIKNMKETVVNSFELWESFNKTENKKANIIQLSITVSLVVLNILNHRFVSLIGCSLSLLKNVKKLGISVSERKFEKSCKITCKIAKTTLSLACKIRPSPELTLLSLALQILGDLGSALNEFENGRDIAGIGKVLLAYVRFNEKRHLITFVKRKWTVTTDQKNNTNKSLTVVGCNSTLPPNPKLDNLRKRIEEAKKTAFLENHPLKDLSKAIDDHSFKINDAEHGVIDFGANFFPYGTTEVKGLNINLRKKSIDGKKYIELTFKVNHVFREMISLIIKEYQQFEATEIEELLTDAGICKGPFEIKKIDNGYLKCKDGEFKENQIIKIGKAWQIIIGNLGAFSVGSNRKILSLYDRVVVQVDEAKSLQDLHTLLTLLGMPNVLKTSSETTIERLKIGHLFRIFFPREATPFERTTDFFELPLNLLKNKIIELVPEMKQKLEKELPQMKLAEILPGKMRFTLPSLALQAKTKGALALTASLVPKEKDEKEKFQDLVNMLKTGALCSELRFGNGMQNSGLSFKTDHASGGSDSVFTQVLEEKNFRKSSLFKTPYSLNESIQIIYSLEVLNSLTYQHYSDHYGTRSIKNQARNSDSDSSSLSSSFSDSDSSSLSSSFSDTDSSSLSSSFSDTDSSSFSDSDSSSESESESQQGLSLYEKRPSILELINNPKTTSCHEVMVKEVIPSKFIIGCIIPNEEEAKLLKEVLRTNGLIKLSGDQELINGVPTHQFIHVSEGITKEILDDCYRGKI